MDQITSLTILEHSQGHYNSVACHGNFNALDGNSLRVFGVIALLVVVLICAAIITAFAGVSLTSCLASGILSILSTWLLILTLIFSILCWCACDDSNSDDCWRWGIVLPVVSAAVIFSLCVIANSIVVFTGADSCGEKQYTAYVQVGVSYILIVTFAAFFVLFINALRDKD